MTHLRRIPKHFENVERLILRAELSNCPHCQAPLASCDYYSFSKTVQQLHRVVVVSARPKKCINRACAHYDQRFSSAAATSIALPDGTFGLDVIAQIGYWRDFEHLDGTQIYNRLRPQLQIGRRQIDLLTKQYRILTAAALALDLPRLVQAVAAHNGLIISLDGLEPEGAAEQLWVVREVSSGLVLAVGWLPSSSSAALQQLLAPIVALLARQGWQLRATVSDRERSLEAALLALWPAVDHQWCQAHYLRNLHKPLQKADQALRVDLRREIRQHNQSDRRRLAEEANSDAFSPCAPGRFGGAVD